MWLFYSYMAFVTVSGAMASFCLPGLSASRSVTYRVNNWKRWMFFAITVVAGLFTSLSGMGQHLPGFDYHWFLLMFSFYYLWLLEKIRDKPLKPVMLKVFQAFSLLSLWISWLVLSANIESKKTFAAVLLVSFAAIFFIAFIPQLQKIIYRVGYLFACMQCALALYYIFEKHWDNLHSSLSTVPGKKGGVLANSTGVLALSGLLFFSLIGLLYKYLKTRNND